MKTQSLKPTFPSILQDYFCQRLINQVNASPRTIASYRDTFRLLLQFLERRLGKKPVSIALEDLDAPLILAFLDHLERERGNSVRTRNARLAAVRSFMHFASAREPSALAIIQRVLAIPPKRFMRPLVGYLSREEMAAILDSTNSSTWSGARDRVMFSTLYNMGARVSELIGIRVADVSLGQSPHVRLRGKGRKERTVPLWKSTAAQLKSWLKRIDAKTGDPVFPSKRGTQLTRSGIEYRLRVAAKQATQSCCSLLGRQISPHVFRHTTAMHLLQSGVDLAVIALWLGHESPTTTHIYMEADLTMKEKALRRVQDPSVRSTRYKPSDSVLQFLESL